MFSLIVLSCNFQNFLFSSIPDNFQLLYRSINFYQFLPCISRAFYFVLFHSFTPSFCSYPSLCIILSYFSLSFSFWFVFSLDFIDLFFFPVLLPFPSFSLVVLELFFLSVLLLLFSFPYFYFFHQFRFILFHHLSSSMILFFLLPTLLCFLVFIMLFYYFISFSIYLLCFFLPFLVRSLLLFPFLVFVHLSLWFFTLKIFVYSLLISIFNLSVLLLIATYPFLHLFSYFFPIFASDYSSVCSCTEFPHPFSFILKILTSLLALCYSRSLF